MAERRDAETLEGEPASRDAGLSRRRRWVLIVVTGALALTVSGVVAAAVIKSPAQAAAEAGAPTPDVLTAPVDYRVLTSSVITRGKVTAGQSVPVAPRVNAGEDAAGAVITKLSARRGQTLKAGQLLMEVSGRPVFALEGKLPVYRDLRPGARGDDVKQLQRSLRQLGHGWGADVPGTFGAGTKAALNSLYAYIGYDSLPSQDDDGSALESARDAVTEAERALEDVKDSGDDVKASERLKAVSRAQQDLTDARQKLARTEAATGPMLPASEVVFLHSFPARVDTVQGKIGGEVAGTVMTVSAGKLIVEAYVPEYQKGLIRAGQKVEIYSEINGISAAAKVTSVADTRSIADQEGQEGEEGDGQAPGGSGYLVEISPVKPLDSRLTGQDVRLTVEAASTNGKALVVPVTAISSGADGRTAVTVIEGTGARRRVELRPGTTGDGFVAVTPVKPGTLDKGDKVITGVGQGASGDGR